MLGERNGTLALVDMFSSRYLLCFYFRSSFRPHKNVEVGVLASLHLDSDFWFASVRYVHNEEQDAIFQNTHQEEKSTQISTTYLQDRTGKMRFGQVLNIHVIIKNKLSRH